MKKIELILKNLLLRILLLLKGKSNLPVKDSFDENSKILFIRLNRIGDALVTTPLLHEIKRSLKSKIYVLADRKNLTAYTNNQDIDKLVIFEKGVKGFLDILRFIKDNNIDTVVDLHDDVSTTVSFLIALCNAQNKFGLEKENKNIYTRTIPKPNSNIHHVVDRVMEISKLFNIQPDKSRIKLHYYLDKASIENADKFISGKFGQNKFLAGINISAGSDARFWGIDNFKSLLGYLSNYDINILLLSSPKDSKAAVKIAGKEYNYFYSNNFSEFAAVISKLDLLFTPDTAAVHLASAFGISTFGIFVKYNTQDLIWSPYKTKFDCIVTTGHNLCGITVEQVTAGLKPFLETIILEYNAVK
jgi:ADP-heptose:LPS heptosyltransferase